ncbi:inositol monophosphatase family protein [Schlesneria sp. T3-172]|uniref:inositol monophosphatase family protein n=1 Tax=Schlesneria sphaerica TaxID=3373610 RepID=UPI0037CBC7BD
MTTPTASLPPSSEMQSRLEFGIRVAREASELILRYYQATDLAVERKGDSSPVTEADKGAELLIRKELELAFPNDAILGEEFPDKVGTSGFRWILDPIDGTKSFIHGVPLFGTLIGVEYDSRCVIGVVRFPALNEVVYAAKGSGAWWQIGDREPRRVRASDVNTFDEATFCTTNITRWQKIGRADTLQTLLDSVKLARGWGDCFGHMLVATGRAELMIDPSMNPWDAAALLPIVEEAGACFVDWKGDSTIYGGNGLSVVNGLKDQVLGLLRKTYEIDGENFNTLEEFYDEIERVLIPGVAWGRNLDAFNDLLRGGMGTPPGGFILRWKNAAKSKVRLGFVETIRQLEARLKNCHPANRSVVQQDLKLARSGHGATVFDWLVEAIRDHGADGKEPDDGVELILE